LPESDGANMDSVVQHIGGFEQYLTTMAEPGTWGDGLTLSGAAQLYRRNIKVVCSDGSVFTIDGPPADFQLNTEPITIGYFGTNAGLHQYHYVSLSLRAVSASLEEASDVPETQAMPERNDANKQPVAPVTDRVTGGPGTVKGPEEKATANSKASSKLNSKQDKVFMKRQADYPWLMPTDGGGALCRICVSFYSTRNLPGDHSGTFVTKPFSNWKKSTGSKEKNNKLLKHSRSDLHRTAVSFSAEQHVMETTARTVYSMIHDQSEEQRLSNLERIADYIDASYFLFKNEIAHTTNYTTLLKLVSRLDGSRQIQKFMDLSPINATYASFNTATEFLQSVSTWLTDGLCSRIRKSPAIAVLADESTDIRTRTELSVCIRFVEDGMAVESFLGLQQLKSTCAEGINNEILQVLNDHHIPLHKIFWMAFDGASNMSGRKNGVQALLTRNGLVNGHYIHCRSHLLHLAAANAAVGFKPLQMLLSTLNSVWKFFHSSPKRHNILVDMQKILADCELQLVSTGNTRWTSHYRAVRAVRMNLRALVLTLQEIHCAAADLSSEAGGLLLTFQNETSILLLHALEQILHPLYILTLTLQSPKLSLIHFPEKIELAKEQLLDISHNCETYSKECEQFLSEKHFKTVGEPCIVAEIHSSTVQPYICKIVANLERRFGDAVGKLSLASTIFHPGIISNKDSVEQHESLRTVCSFYKVDPEEALSEWRCLVKYLSRHQDDSPETFAKTLLTTDVGDSYPTMAHLAAVTLACPLGTAGVERSFSTMNRICNRLRQRMTGDHLSDLVNISQEGPPVLSRSDLLEIAYVWYKQSARRIQLPTKTKTHC